MEDIDNEEYLDSLLSATKYWDFQMTFQDLGYDLKTVKKIFVTYNPETFEDALDLLAIYSEQTPNQSSNEKIIKDEDNKKDIKLDNKEDNKKEIKLDNKEDNKKEIKLDNKEDNKKVNKEDNKSDNQKNIKSDNKEDNKDNKNDSLDNIKLEDINEKEVEENLIIENYSEEKFDLDINMKKMLYYKGQKSTCKIIKDKETGIGFFCKINLNGNKMRFLLTNNHILNKYSLIFENQIKCETQKKGFTLLISQERRFFTNEKLDYTVIEMFEYDEIESFFEIQNSDEKITLNEKIGIIEYLDDKIKIKTGKIKEINDLEIKHDINEDNLSSGSPIILLNEKIKVIGIHNFIKNENNKHNNILILNIINNMIKNEIICEYENKNKNSKHKLFHINLKSNESENLELYLNNNKIDYCINYTFENEGKYNLKLVSNNLLFFINIFRFIKL